MYFNHQFSSVYFPTLKEFLEITNLLKYATKLKKLKCVETEDLLSALPEVRMKYVEEARVYRYVEHYTEQRLTSAITMEQPISLEEFFRKASLQTVFKMVKAFGVTEFDDLFCIKNKDIIQILPKKIEFQRYKRHLERYKTYGEKKIDNNMQNTDVENKIDLDSFLSEAYLKKYKNEFKKLGVFSKEDLLCITPEDIPKMSHVEFGRFTRYRDKIFDNMLRPKYGGQCDFESAPSLLQSPIQEVSPSYKRPIQYSSLGNVSQPESLSPSVQETIYENQPSFNPHFAE